MRISSSSARRYRPDVVEPVPVASGEISWRGTYEIATVGIFVLFAVAALEFSRAFFLPVTLAIVIGTMMAPLADKLAQYRIPSWLAALLLVAIFLTVLSVVIVVLSGFVTEWATKSPEIGSTFRQKLVVLDRPLAALRDVQGKISEALGVDIGALKFDMTGN